MRACSRLDHVCASHCFSLDLWHLPQPSGLKHVDPMSTQRDDKFSPPPPLTFVLFCRAPPDPLDLPVLLAQWELVPAVLAATLASQASQAQSVPSAPRAIRVAVAAWASPALLAPPGRREGQAPWAPSGLLEQQASQARWDHTACLDLQVCSGLWQTDPKLCTPNRRPCC